MDLANKVSIICDIDVVNAAAQAQLRESCRKRLERTCGADCNGYTGQSRIESRTPVRDHQFASGEPAQVINQEPAEVAGPADDQYLTRLLNCLGGLAAPMWPMAKAGRSLRK